MAAPRERPLERFSKGDVWRTGCRRCGRSYWEHVVDGRRARACPGMYGSVRELRSVSVRAAYAFGDWPPAGKPR